jgi:type I restriction enzyme M protein
MCEIIKNNYNLNISRYVNISVDTEKIDLHSVSKKIDEIDKIISEAKDTHNGFLKELGLPEL